MPAAEYVHGLPTLDLSTFDGSPDERRAFVEKLRDPALIEKTLAVAHRFFALPEKDAKSALP